MKIEIGESLIYSWLRHVKGCQLVQTNWMSSAGNWKIQHRERLIDLMEIFNVHFFKKYNYSIFKKTTSLDQLLKQAEIDVLGMNYIAGGYYSNNVYAVDVAFHEQGLNYGDKAETVQRVVKKCIRSILCISAYFGIEPGFFGLEHGTIIFTSPFIQPGIRPDLVKCFEDMKGILAETAPNFDLQLICNEDFQQQVLKPVLDSVDTIADTTELFVRSVKLSSMLPKNLEPMPISIMQPSQPTVGQPQPIPKKDINFIKYLTDVEKLQWSTAKARASNCQRIEEFEGSIEMHYLSDQCKSLLEKLKYTSGDVAQNRPISHTIPIDGNQYTGTSTLKSALTLYIKFLHYLEQIHQKEA